MKRRASKGKVAHTASAPPRLDWMMKTPPFFSPDRGLEWVKTLGSGDITTST